MILKEKIKNKKIVVGSWITIGHPTIVEIMAKAGFDWLAIDMEHASISIDQCQELIRTIDLCGIPALVRVGANDPLLIKQAMDSGATGVIVPMINTKEEAQKAVSAVKYPPLGIRGVGLARAQGYGTKFNEYKDSNDKESIVIVQIEHAKAVENLEDILRVEGVDAFIVGPYDLSASLGIPGEFKNDKMLDTMDHILGTAKKLNKVAGFHSVSSNVEMVKAKIDEGYTFIAYGVDFLFLGDNCREGMKQINL